MGSLHRLNRLVRLIFEYLDWKLQKPRMYLMYYLNNEGERVYTLKHVDPNGKPTFSAHPARFSPEDKYSQHRLSSRRDSTCCRPRKPRLFINNSEKLYFL